jgi:hypothetical protein
MMTQCVFLEVKTDFQNINNLSEEFYFPGYNAI